MVVFNQVPAVFRDGSMERQIDRLLEDAVQSVNSWASSWEPQCNVFENEQGLTMQLALPGMEADRIRVQVEQNELRISGERKWEGPEARTWHARNIEEGTFACTFRLPTYTDHSNVSASYRQGLLTITIPKREEAKPRQIKIACE